MIDLLNRVKLFAERKPLRLVGARLLSERVGSLGGQSLAHFTTKRMGKPDQGGWFPRPLGAFGLILGFVLCLFPFPSSEANTLPERFRPLVDDSPFLTAAFRARMEQADRPQANLAFHGFATLGGETFFSILNRGDSRGYLLSEGQEQDEIKVVSFNQPENKLVVHFKGSEITLSLESVQ